MDNPASEIKDFIVQNFLFGQSAEALAENQSFLETGIVDSTGMLELVGFVEQRYGISIADRELVPENLDSLRNISRFILAKQAASIKVDG